MSDVIRSTYSLATLKSRLAATVIVLNLLVYALAAFPLFLTVGLAQEEYLAEWRTEALTHLALAALITLVTLVSAKMLLIRCENERGAVARLKDNQRQLADIIEFLPDATLAIDTEGRVIIWNRAIEAMTGVSAAEMIGKGDYSYAIPFYGTPRPQLIDLISSDLDEIAVIYPRIIRSGDTLMGEVFCPALYGKKGAWIFAKTSPLHDQSGTTIGVIESIRDITELKMAEDSLRSYASRLIEMEEELRKNIAAELHDDIGRDLTVLGMNVAVINNGLANDAPRKLFERVEDSERLIGEISRTVRGIMAGLRPPVLDEYGLHAAIRWHADLFSKRTGITVLIQADETFPRLRDNKETALFRIVQEALMNAAKHADTLIVTVKLDSSVGVINLAVADGGKGFLPGTAHNRKESGWGLKIMRERAELIGGSFRLDSEPGKGTLVSVTLPFEDV